ncbi:MAG: PhnD/SsuA/transferrin family substrate-binding protein [Pseudomonadota bacterium]
MIAQLGMYDWPHMRTKLDAFWSVLREEAAARGVDLPEHLSHDLPLREVWTEPDLTIAMCCGWNVVSGEVPEARVFARPDWDHPGHPQGTYHSVMVCRVEDVERPLAELMGRPAANGANSWSGWHLFRHFAAQEGLPLGTPVWSGSHRVSIKLVLDGKADCAAIDRVSFGLAQALGETDGLVSRAALPAFPSTPFIIGPNMPLAAERSLRDALNAALKHAGGAPWAEGLGLLSVIETTQQEYHSMRSNLASTW